jgi:hypothetical protein
VTQTVGNGGPGVLLPAFVVFRLQEELPKVERNETLRLSLRFLLRVHELEFAARALDELGRRWRLAVSEKISITESPS